MLATAPDVFYIHEPFSVTDSPGPGVCNARFRYWFTHVDRHNEGRFYPPIKRMLELRYDWIGAILRVRRPSQVLQVHREWAGFRRQRRCGARPLVKDPIALFAAEWLAERLGMMPVVVIRHPAAFVSSIVKLQWQHPFHHFVQQPRLVGRWLSPFAEQIAAYAAKEHSVLEQAILLWRITHHVIAEYRKNHPDWLYVRHEDVSRDPLGQFEHLFHRLGLTWRAESTALIAASSRAGNPVDPDAPVGSEATLTRDSEMNIWNWKRRLSDQDISRIHAETGSIARQFYAETEW